MNKVSTLLGLLTIPSLLPAGTAALAQEGNRRGAVLEEAAEAMGGLERLRACRTTEQGGRFVFGCPVQYDARGPAPLLPR